MMPLTFQREQDKTSPPHPVLAFAMNGVQETVVNDYKAAGSKEASSSSGSSESSSSSGDESSSSSSAPDKGPQLWKLDQVGYYIIVKCAENEAKFYKHRFARGSIGKCVWFRERWITPNEFQAVSGRQSSKDWKRSIRLQGRCLKDFISEGLFEEHSKTCTCKICQGEDKDFRKQEGVMALATKRRKLSHAGIESSQSQGHYQQSLSENEAEEVDIESDVLLEGEEVSGEVKVSTGSKRKIKSSVKSQRVWSPSGEMAQEVSSNEEEYLPVKHINAVLDNDAEVGCVIGTDTPHLRRSTRTAHQKQTGYRTELGVFTHSPANWDTDEVAEFMRTQGFSEYSKSFQEYDINGQSMFLLREHHLLERFDMKLGPTLRLLDTISRLRHPPTNSP